MSAVGSNLPWDEKDDAVSERAAGFFARRRFGSWSEADQAELDAWLAESVLHEVAWLRVQGIAAEAAELFAFRPAKQVASAPAAESRPGYRRFVFPLLAAASVALVAALGIPLVRSLMQPDDQVFGTNVGGRALLKFTDGTEVELNTDTAVRYRMTTEQRTVWLDRGEAYFRVTHNAANPFTVVAGGHRITDIGTEFLVREDAGTLNVSLMKGSAQLATEKPGAAAAVLVAGDEAVATRGSTTVTQKTPQELADELAWQRGALVFRDTRLADAVREFNRYNTIKLVVADPSIADMKFSAELRSNNVEGFLQLAETVLNLRVERDGSSFLISRGPREKTKKAAHIKRS